MLIPTDVGAKAQPAEKPHGYQERSLASAFQSQPTTTTPKTMGSPVPKMATKSDFLPTAFTLSKWMCMPDSMIMRVTPTLPRNVHGLPM